MESEKNWTLKLSERGMVEDINTTVKASDELGAKRKALKLLHELGLSEYVDTWDGACDALGSLELNKSNAQNLLPLINIGAWEGQPPARRSLWGDWLPVHQTTMLTGAGGVGKSLFDQALCTAIALGKPFLGMDTVQRNTLYITCEDNEEELWRRQDDICSAFGVTRDDLLGKLNLCQLTGAPDTALAIENEQGLLSPTERWQELINTCEALDIGLFAFDNATDALAADLNAMHPVASFVNMLTGLAIKCDGVAMIIHHPNKAGDDWLGSVGWHNKVRSRLIIQRNEDDADADRRTIENPKANYGPSGGLIDFRWHNGCFVRDEDLPADQAAELAKTIRIQHENTVFLNCLRTRREQGREVGASIGPNYAPKQFEQMTEAKGVKKHKLVRAMERLFHIGAIEIVEVKREGKGGTKSILVEVAQTTPEPSPEPVPNDSPELHRTANRTTPRTSPISKDIEGAATEPPPPSLDVEENSHG